MLKGGTCPDWASDAEEHELPSAFDVARATWMQACLEARQAPPRCKDLRRWHEKLFRDVVPLPYYAGNFRQDDPARLCLGRDVAVAGVDAAHFGHVLRLMHDFERQVIPALAQIETTWGATTPAERLKRVATVIGIAVGRFIQIHPFVNGNGRTSRLLWAVLLARLGLPIEMSVVRRPAGNYGSAMKAAMSGNFAPAVALVAAGIVKMRPPASLPV